MSSRTPIWTLLCCAFALIFAGAGRVAHASGTFLSIGNRIDILPDAERHLLYITSGYKVLRYNWLTNTYETPYTLGTTSLLKSMDISADGKTLAVTDSKRNGEIIGLYIVDLTTGTPRRIEWTRTSLEGGTFSVAFTASGTLLVTTSFEGSGWVPLRRIDLNTDAITSLGTINQNTMLCASGNRAMVGFAESNNSSGPWGTYEDSTGVLVRRQGYTDGTSAYNFEIGANRDGTQFSIPTYMGTYVYNDTFSKTQTIGTYAAGQPIGAAYNPTENIVYFPWAQSNMVRAYNTDTWQMVGTYDAETSFTHTGNHAFQSGRTRVASDGSVLATTVSNGIRLWKLKPEPTPTPTATATPQPTATVTPVPTATATATPVPTATATPEPTATAIPTATPLPTATPIATATPLPTSTPRPTATPIPVPRVTVTLSPVNPLTRDRLKATVAYQSTARVTLRYEWFRGTQILPERSAILDLSRAGYGDRGDVITVKVTPFVGAAMGVTAKAYVRVQNTPPVIYGKSARTKAGVPIEIALPVRDDDGDALGFVLLAKPLGGTVTFSLKDGVYILRYVPRAGWSGVENLKVRAFDPSRSYSDCVVAIGVTPATPPRSFEGGSGGIARLERWRPFA